MSHDYDDSPAPCEPGQSIGIIITAKTGSTSLWRATVVATADFNLPKFEVKGETISDLLETLAEQLEDLDEVLDEVLEEDDD